MDRETSRWRKPKKRGRKNQQAKRAREAKAANAKPASVAAPQPADLTSTPSTCSYLYFKEPIKKRKKTLTVESPIKRSISTQTDRDSSFDVDSASDTEETILYRVSTASERKLAQFDELLPLRFTEEDDLENILVQKSVFSKLFKNYLCPECKKKNVSVNFEDRKGFCYLISVKCQLCESLIVQEHTSGRVHDDNSTRPPFSVNRHIDEMLLETRGIIREVYVNEDPSLQDSPVIDITVSFDGSWQKRGPTSNYGVGFVVDTKTGLILDMACASKYCHPCVLQEKALGAGTPEHKLWYEQHLASGMCKKNYDGSSKSMENAIAKILWDRSVSGCKMRYTTMLSDGDASIFDTFNHLSQNNPYDIPINKEECINHVSKRLSTALKNKVAQCKAKGIMLGGSGAGQLTENVIMKLASYYRNAIQVNSNDTKSMKRATLAAPYHCASTDKKPNHKFCSQGKESWCFYNRARAKKEKPDSHQSMSLKLNETVFKNILPGYERLSDDELLK
ncbi:Alpha-keto-acid decarboxylase, partial [Frankliniella fusca]